MFATLWETFESIILPRRVTRRFRLTRLFYQVSWAIWSTVNRWLPSKKVRETHLSYFGPLSLLMLFATWAFALVVAFALAGRIDVDLRKDAIASDKQGKPVYLADLWPSQRELSGPTSSASTSTPPKPLHM